MAMATALPSLMTNTTTSTPVAPSATAPAGVTTAAPVPAPSAEPAAPSTLADFAALASASLQASDNPQFASASGSPAETDVAPEPPLETPPAAPEGDDLAEPEPTAEEVAAMSESEQRILGALQKEREKRREARAELKAMRDELETLKQQLTAAPPEPTPAAEPQAAEPAPANAPEATVLPSDPLADCQTFDQVDARAMQAAQLESRVLRLQQQLARDGAEPVKAALLAQGVKELQGQPLEAVDESAIGDFLTRVYEGARVTQISAEPRKRFIAGQAQAFQEAQTIIPELADAKSARAKEYAAFVKARPWLPRFGPNWPVIAATHMLGEVAVRHIKSAKSAPSPAPQPPVAKVATAKSAPAAPTRTASTLPQPKELDAISAKMANGTATPAEIATYASRQVTAPR